MNLTKKTTAVFLILAMIMSLGAYATPPGEVPASNRSAANEAEMQRLANRLEEIRAMDLENMPRSEKRKYAREVKKIQKKMNAVGGGLYISAGALLVIVVLLILLL